MSYRQISSSGRNCYTQPQTRLNQQIKCETTDEGCPVIEESGTVCGETNSLNVFQEFRQIYDDCLRNLEGSATGSVTLTKLAPFKKLIDDLWEQNALLVETVEELEHEATCRVTNLQDRLNKSCQKICDYKDDIKCLVNIIQSFCENGVFDPTGLQFKTFCCSSVFGNCADKSPCKRDTKKSCVSIKKEQSSSRSTLTYNCSGEFEKSKDNCCYKNIGTTKSRNLSQVKIKPEPSLLCDSESNNIQIHSNGNCKCDFLDTCEASENSFPPVNINFKLENSSINEDAECSCNCSCTSYFTTDC